MKVFLLVEYAVRTVFMLSVIFFVSGNHSGNSFDYLCNIYGGFFLSDAYSFFSHALSRLASRLLRILLVVFGRKGSVK